jgi:hypothetical protein
LTKLYEDYQDGIVDEEFLIKYRNEKKERIEEIKGRLVELEEDKEFWEERVGNLIQKAVLVINQILKQKRIKRLPRAKKKFIIVANSLLTFYYQ